MAEAWGLMSCPSTLALESSALTLSNQLSRMPEVQYSLVHKLSRHGGKSSRFALKNLISKHDDNLLHDKQLFWCAAVFK